MTTPSAKLAGTPGLCLAVKGAFGVAGAMDAEALSVSRSVV